MGERFAFDRRWRFEAGPDRLWAVLAETERYPEWFSWLDRFECSGLRAGSEARFVVRPPLPYKLSLTVDVIEAVPGERVVAMVGGDLEGPARLELAGDGTGTEARLVWSLALCQPVLVRLEQVARPLMVWGHDVVVAQGIRQFRRRALAWPCNNPYDLAAWPRWG